jgi:hypothetical protein
MTVKTVDLKTSHSEAPSGNTNQALNDMLLMLLTLVKDLSDLFSKGLSVEATISDAMGKISKNQADEMLAQMKKENHKIARQQSHAKKVGLFSKLAGIVMLGASLIGGPATGMLAVGLFLSTTPGLFPGLHGQSLLDRAATKMAAGMGGSSGALILSKLILTIGIVVATKGAGGTKMGAMAGLQTTVGLNTMSDLTTQFFKSCGKKLHMNDTQIKDASEYVALVINIVLIGISMKCAVTGGSTWKFAQEGSEALKAGLRGTQMGLYAGSAALGASSSTFQIQTGQIMGQIADTLEDLADVRGRMASIQSTQKGNESRQKGLDNSLIKEVGTMTAGSSMWLAGQFAAARALAG